MTRLVLSALLATLTLLGASPQALAHTELVSSDPANGASLPQRPSRLALTFTEPVPAESATVTITGPDGSGWPLGEVTAEGPTLLVAMQETAAPAGLYTVDWMVQSLDGDFVDGKITFTVPAPPAAAQPAVTPTTAPPAVTTATGTAAPTTGSEAVVTVTAVQTGTSTPAAASAADDDGGVPLWVWILIVAVLSVLGISVAVALSRRASRPAADEQADKPAE